MGLDLLCVSVPIRGLFNLTNTTKSNAYGVA